MGRRPRLVVSAVATLSVWAATAIAAVNPTPRLLDVPYLSQTEDLCGGAALAMVLRYWGEREVYPEDFSALVDRSKSGIHTDVLAAEVSRRGWQSFPLNMAAAAGGDRIRDHVDRGRPMVALIEVRPARFHYVVIVAWTADQVIAHDPALAPFRVMSRIEFERAWASAGRWALLILPPSTTAAERAPSPSRGSASGTATGSDRCRPFIHESVALARNGDIAAAETGLLAATALCPNDPAAWRELAGVRFLQSRWADASAFAGRAARLDPGDEQGWELLATSRFLNDEPRAALDAWNRLGRPSIDVVRIEGARRTRHPVIAGLVDLSPRTLLTAEQYDRAARRLNELPSGDVGRLRYHPVSTGLADIEAVVVERPVVPSGRVPLAAAAARSWLQHELRVEVASPTGSGELWTAAWRWWENRPRLGFGVAVPSAFGLPGVMTIEGFWERQSYQTSGPLAAGAPAIAEDERRRAALSVSDWRTGHLRWQAGAALDRWAEESHLSMDAGVDVRLAGDRLSLDVRAAAWTPIGSGDRFARGEVSAAWRSTREPRAASWLLRTGFAGTSVRAPFDLWPGAGTGDARAPLLRAHPLVKSGIVSGPAFGRRLAHATAEYQRPLLTTPGGSIAWAGFADIGSAWRRMGVEDRGPTHTDVGAGIRLALRGKGGVIRIDVARGLQDRQVVLSTGWQAPWPGR